MTDAEKQAARALHRKTKGISWQEEVKLSTGEVIVIEHEARFRQELSGPFASKDWVPDGDCLRFRYPAGSKDLIEWCTLRYGPRQYSPETPLVLDVESGQRGLYVISINAGMGACDEYFRYRYDGGTWRDDMMPETFEPRPANLLIESKGVDTPSTLSLDVKRKKNADRYTIRYRTVGPDRCICGTLNNPNKGGCLQKYNAK